MSRWKDNYNPDSKRVVAIYARVSTEHEAQISALDNQIQYYDNILKQHPTWELYDRYIDEGITGTSVKKRKNFLRMMQDAKDGKFDLILTREVSRFARNTVDTLQQTRILKSQGVEVYFTEDNIWTLNDEDGELRLTIMATLAQNESKKTSMRVKAGQMVSFQKGVAYGNGNILGYNRVGKELVVNEKQAEIVQYIYDLYESGKGVTAIARQLEQEGYKTAMGKTRWDGANVNRILKNPFYCGIVVYRKQYVPDYLEQKKINNFGDVEKITVQGTHTPIITVEQFEKVQKILKSKTISIGNDRRKGINPPKDVWMRKMVCQCGHKFNHVTWHRTAEGFRQLGYRCNDQARTGSVISRQRKGLSTEGICTVKMFPQWKINAAAHVVFQQFWNDKEGVIRIANEMLDRYYVDEPDDTIEKRIELERKIKAWDNRYDNLVNMRLDGEIDKDRYDLKKAELEKEKAKLNDQLMEINPITINTEDNYKEKLKMLKYGLDNDFQVSSRNIPDDIIDLLVKEVIVTNDGFIFKLNMLENDRDNVTKYTVSGKKDDFEVTQIERIEPMSSDSSTGCY